VDERRVDLSEGGQAPPSLLVITSFRCDQITTAIQSTLRQAMARPLPKEEVRKLLDAIPDGASYEDIQYHIYVQQKIDRGLEASDRGDFISDEEIERGIARWAGE
jgi:predicted transcriptional regulator